MNKLQATTVINFVVWSVPYNFQSPGVTRDYYF